MLINVSRSEEDLEGSSMSKPAFSRADSDDKCGSALSCDKLGEYNEGTAVSTVTADGNCRPVDAAFCAANLPGPDAAWGGAAINVGEKTGRDVSLSLPPHPVSGKMNSSIQ
jgi:hypothetical protein